ncbi:MAG: metal ABC transporter permease [Mesorhizobium sp.]|nr:metal ABC transporter permease [Mesorhizobium sp.]MCO5161426.1 metal ABC transporter permease [Mesorhizobium sp.]
MIETLLLPFSFPFMQQAFIVSLLVALPMGLLSPFLVLKGWSLMGDAVSHAVLPGVVLAYLAGLPIGIGAFAAGMFCAVGTGYLRENSRIKEDTVMGVLFSGMFGLGLVLYSMIETELHLDHILFGDMLGVGWVDIAEAGAIAAIVSAALLVRGRDLMLHAFDPQHARAIGLGVGLLHYGLLVLLSLSIVGALKSVGIILAIALLIAPGAIGFLVARRFGVMLAVSVAVAVVASFLGVYLSFFLDSAPAPTIVLLMSGTFVVAFLRAGIASPAEDAAT